MQVNGLGGYRTIDDFVKSKLSSFNTGDISFMSLFEMMFREKDNVLYERSSGYRIVTTTYGEAYDETLRLASGLRERLGDIPRDSVVGLYMKNGLEWIETFWALLAAGYRPLLMNLRLPEPVLEQALADADARAVVSDGPSFSLPTVAFGSVTPGEPLTLPAPFGSEIFVMSSGTSEHLKICAYSATEFYYQIEESYGIIRRCAAIKKHYKGCLKQLTFLPFYHIFGLVAVYIWFAFFSRTFVHLEDMQPATIVNTIKRHHVTHIFAVPLFWETVYDQAMRTIKANGEAVERKFKKGLALSKRIGGIPLIGPLFIKKAFRQVRTQLFGESICCMISGGSVIPRRVLEFFNCIGYRLANGYGMTEVGITSVELSPRMRVLNSGSVGKPFSAVEYKINEDGELLIRGRSTASRIIEGGRTISSGDWYNTHDLAECVSGRYYILGRHDDVIVAPNGENLNPELIEPYFKGADVGGAALIKEDFEGGTRPVLLVSVKRSLPKDRFAAVDARVRRTASDLGLTAQSAAVVYISDPVISESDFKVNRSRLKNAYAAGKLNVLPPEQFDAVLSAADDPVFLKVRDIFAASLCKEPDEIREDSDFFIDERGTSLDYLAMISGLQEAFGVSLPTNSDKSLSTLAQIYDYVSTGVGHVD